MKTLTPEMARRAADTIRLLAADGVQKANSGHPGMPMGMADCALILFHRFLRFNPQEPEWPGRDRFILSAGHGSMLLYAMLHLCGYHVSLDDLKNFRQLGSPTAGHPEYGHLPGVETTTGPLGQGFATGVGMALAARMEDARFGGPWGKQRVFAIVSDGDLMEGVSAEAASLAGHLKLGNLVYLYDDNRITIEGRTDLAFSESVQQRFDAYGWHTLAIDGHDYDAITQALQAGVDETQRPTLILARTTIGFGSPNKADTSGVHGAPLGEEELLATRRNLGFPEDKPFYVPADVRSLFEERIRDCEDIYRLWQQQETEWAEAEPELARQRSSMAGRQVPHELEAALLDVMSDASGATRALSGQVMQKIAELLPGFVGGSADLEPSTKTALKDSGSVCATDFSGRNLHFGIREHAMGSVMNGLALSGIFLPFGATFFVFSDYMRPAIRLAALMKLQVVYVFTHDSLFVGEDGPTHQPVEHLAALRAIPGLTVIRPADNVETALAWAYAVRNSGGPTALCLTRQKVKNLPHEAQAGLSMMEKGAYVVWQNELAAPDVLLAATGSEVGAALEAASILETQSINARVVSVPCLGNFMKQPEEYRESVLPAHIPAAVVEAGIAQGWHALNRSPKLMLTMDGFGESGPASELAEKFGFTGARVAERVQSWLKGF